MSILIISSLVGRNPENNNPAEPIAIPVLMIITAISEEEARIFPRIMESLYIGWDTRRLSVPLFFSELMESNPKISPIKGPIKAISDINEGIELPPAVNSLRNRKLLSNEDLEFMEASLSALLIPVTDPYTLAIVIAITRIKMIKKRLLVT